MNATCLRIVPRRGAYVRPVWFFRYGVGVWIWRVLFTVGFSIGAAKPDEATRD